jgi:hypothetical protein
VLHGKAHNKAHWSLVVRFKCYFVWKLILMRWGLSLVFVCFLASPTGTPSLNTCYTECS